MKSLILTAFLFLQIAFVNAQTARVQVIHNSADAAASTVDVYLGTTKILDDFAFRTASPFIDVTAGVPIKVSIAPSSSSSVADSIAVFNYNLMSGSTYVLIAEGIVSATGYSPATPFDIKVYGMGREVASNTANTDVLVHHGATDAPAVDVVETGAGAGTIVANASYGDFAPYLELATADYVLQVRAAGASSAVAAFDAPLATLGLQGAALTVVASGFLDPSANSNGPAFGLFAAPATGGAMVALPASAARLQAIHNSADAAASTVDVYLDGNLLIDDFAFRTASPFIDAPAEVDIQLVIAPATSSSVADSIAVFNYNLASGETYVLVAEGIVSATGYSPATPFDINVYGMGREAASNSANTDVLVHHGATDAPAVDVVETGAGAGTIVANASYGDFAPYLELATADYVLQVRAAGASSAVAAFDAPLATLGLQGAALTVVASGFLDPSANSNGPAFGLFAAPATGGAMVALPASKSRLQAIHNSADAAAATVDVYLNGDLLIDDFDFRTASPFIDAPAEVDIQLVIAPPTSTSIADSIAVFNYNLTSGATYILVAEGIVSATGYSPATPFGINVYGMAREEASISGNTDVLVHHGATDAPAVDVVEVGIGAGTIVANASYGDFAPYLELGTNDYRIEVRAAGTTTAVATYDAPLSTLSLQDSAITVIASGFLDPSVNSNGAAFGLYVALPEGGTLIPLPIVTGLASLQSIDGLSMNIAQNPVLDDNLNLLINSSVNRNVQLSVIDMSGRVIETLNTDLQNGENTVSVHNLPIKSGVYVVLLSNGEGVNALRFVKK